jgi:elongation factor P
MIDRAEATLLYCLFAPELSNAPACLEPASGRLVIPDAAAFLARLNFRNRKLSRELMSSVKATQLRPGMVIQHEGQLFTVFSTEHRTPGNKRGSMQTRMKNLKTGAIIDYRFRAEEFVNRAILDEVEFEYLYNEGDDFHFMNTKNYEQMQMSREELGETVYYLIPSTLVKVEFFEEKPIGVDLPDTMEMKVVQTEPTLQKATASAVMKPATLETGLVVQVPPFVNEGDRIKVDTSEARYVQRVE